MFNELFAQMPSLVNGAGRHFDEIDLIIYQGEVEIILVSEGREKFIASWEGGVWVLIECGNRAFAVRRAEAWICSFMMF